MSVGAPGKLQVVSAQMPCGAAWLANALIELGLSISNLWGFDTAAEWQLGADGSRRYVAEHGPWRQTLAALQPGRRLPPAVGPDVVFSHSFPWALPVAEQRILIVRDPRDALHSEWQRQRRNAGCELGFEQFLRSDFFDTGLAQIDYLWWHLQAWTSIWQSAASPCLLIRFEDFKRQPTQALRRIASWLQLIASEADIANACECSDVRHLQSLESKIAEQSSHSRQFNRRGQAYEWRQAWPENWHANLGPHWDGLLRALRYADRQSVQGTPSLLPPAPDARALARWQGIETSTVEASCRARCQLAMRELHSMSSASATSATHS